MFLHPSSRNCWEELILDKNIHQKVNVCEATFHLTAKMELSQICQSNEHSLTMQFRDRAKKWRYPSIGDEPGWNLARLLPQFNLFFSVSRLEEARSQDIFPRSIASSAGMATVGKAISHLRFLFMKFLSRTERLRNRDQQNIRTLLPS